MELNRVKFNRDKLNRTELSGIVPFVHNWIQLDYFVPKLDW